MRELGTRDPFRQAKPGPRPQRRGKWPGEKRRAKDQAWKARPAEGLAASGRRGPGWDPGKRSRTAKEDREGVVRAHRGCRDSLANPGLHPRLHGPARPSARRVSPPCALQAQRRGSPAPRIPRSQACPRRSDPPRWAGCKTAALGRGMRFLPLAAAALGPAQFGVVQRTMDPGNKQPGTKPGVDGLNPS